MRHNRTYFKALHLVLLLVISVFFLAACGVWYSDEYGQDKPNKNGTSAKQSAMPFITPSTKPSALPSDNMSVDDTGNGTSPAQSAKPSASSSPSASDSSKNDNSKLNGAYKWVHKDVESNWGGTAVAFGDILQITINSDGSGRFNTSIPFQISGNELLVDWNRGDKGVMTGKFSITTVDGKTHIEGTIKSENSDGFYTKETWVLDQQ